MRGLIFPWLLIWCNGSDRKTMAADQMVHLTAHPAANPNQMARSNGTTGARPRSAPKPTPPAEGIQRIQPGGEEAGQPHTPPRRKLKRHPAVHCRISRSLTEFNGPGLLLGGVGRRGVKSKVRDRLMKNAKHKNLSVVGSPIRHQVATSRMCFRGDGHIYSVSERPNSRFPLE